MNVDPSIPLGHIIPAHRTFGWCSHCPDHTPAEELAAWQTRELRRLFDETPQPVAAAHSCPNCDGIDPGTCLTNPDRAAAPAVAQPDEEARVAAAVASCPGYETSPNPCRCPCYGCKHHCSAHQPDEEADAL